MHYKDKLNDIFWFGLKMGKKIITVNTNLILTILFLAFWAIKPLEYQIGIILCPHLFKYGGRAYSVTLGASVLSSVPFCSGFLNSELL